MRTTAGIFFRRTQAAAVAVSLVTLSGCVTGNQNRHFPPREARGVEEIIPLTVSNLNGHKTLFREGLYIISSSEKALAYAKRHSLISSGLAIEMVMNNYKASSGNFLRESKKNISEIPGNTKKVFLAGSDATGKILSFTHSVAGKETEYGNRQFAKAGEAFIAGNTSIAKRSEKDREALKKIPLHYYRSIRKDLRGVNKVFSLLLQDKKGSLLSPWEGATGRMATEFNRGYNESGKKRNSLAALVPLLAGYGRSLYSGLFSPTAETGSRIGKKVAKTGAMVVSGLVVVPGRTFQSLGLAFFHGGKTGYHLLSPSVKSVAHAALASISYTLVPITYVAGGSAGVISKVAFSGGAPVYAAGNGAVDMTDTTVKYLGSLIHDGVKGGVRVGADQLGTVAVLGYNAITALPAHLLMAFPDAAIFALWDGPRLAIAAAREITSSGDAERQPANNQQDIKGASR